MKEIKDHIVDTYHIVLDGDSVITYGCTLVNQVTSTNDNFSLEQFTVEQEWENRLTELGITINESNV